MSDDGLPVGFTGDIGSFETGTVAEAVGNLSSLILKNGRRSRRGRLR
jgi:hypothetical protein